MPEDLITATKDYAARKEATRLLPDAERVKAKEDFDKLIASREAYRMQPKGTPDMDGCQRFLYPKPGSYMAINRATNSRIRKPNTPGSITIPLDAGASTEAKDNPRIAVKHLQKYAYKSPEHTAHYGMRNLVESANKSIKGKNFEDIANVSKRSGRGFAFNYLAATLAAVSANLRKIADFFALDAVQTTNEPLTRERRRKDSTGKALSKHSALPALAPPR